MAHPLAGKPAPSSVLVDLPRLLAAYANETPDPSDPSQRVAFGTSGHRGTSFKRAFNERHILAVVQATVEWRTANGITGPLFLGADTHALSEPAHRSAIEVLAAFGVETFVAANARPVPTPVISHAILGWNRDPSWPRADGIVITPSHNPPEDGGIKYNPPNGGPADVNVTSVIEKRANELLANPLEIKRIPYERARTAACIHERDYVTPYVDELGQVLRMDLIRDAKLRLGADPLGGSNLDYWDPIASKFGLDITVVNRTLDPAFGFMTLDHDGRIRMDCSSPYAMASLVNLKDRFDLAFGNDCDSDRHGIVTPTGGLMNPNHFLAVAIDHLFRNRPNWGEKASIGKTLVSSSLIDRVALSLGRPMKEVPVGFKWFVDGLSDGSFGFGGEESAGASFLRLDGTAWSTDKDGIILDLLAAEIRATTGLDPSQVANALMEKLGRPVYTRLDAPANAQQKAVLKKLSPASVKADTLAGQPITARLTKAPGNGADIGGLKVTTADGWFAARPSGTEDVYKIYAESFVDEAHLARIVDEAKAIVGEAFAAAGA